MAPEPMGRDKDLVLDPNSYAFVLDSTKGKVATYVGPFRNSLSNTDQLVTWDGARRRFVPINEPERAIQIFPMAAEGQYVVLSNPAKGEKIHPARGSSSDAVELEFGRKVNISGPTTFPLWPGQVAETIDGHRLRINQYLLVRVYDEEEARKNWKSAIIKPVAKPASAAGESEAEETPASITSGENAPELTMGQLMVIKGTEVSFYMPPTGIEVVKDDEGNFVREAVTLEQLEYCVLLDENGEKNYRQGPDVVFPEPTEKFVKNEEGQRKFRAIDLNEHQGLYVKVIAEYEEDGQTHKVGEELFITGGEKAIYFPRPEHSIIEYGSRKVHYAVAIPKGEGRYVLDRNQGTVDLVQGPKMFLPDPRKQVVVRRILDQHTVTLLYPGNAEAQEINRRYEEMSSQSAPGSHLSDESVRAYAATARSLSRSADDFMGESFRRREAFTQPRTLVLDTKYEGAVAVNIWPGFAILVTDKTGNRRVEVGPKMVLLEYDETLAPLTLSTGKPKSDANPLRTVYLRVLNNQVSDRVQMETRDLVKISVEISYRVNFEGATPEEMLKWFAVEDYVKILTDHARSRMRNAAKRHGIREFYEQAIDILRNALLGEAKEGGRAGLAFNENGMRVYDAEILNVSIETPNVATMLQQAQAAALTGAIDVAKAEESASRTSRLESLKREELKARDETAEAQARSALVKVDLDRKQSLAVQASDLAIADEKKKVVAANLEAALLQIRHDIEADRERSKQELEHMEGETEQFKERMAAMNDKLIEALNLFGDKMFVEKITEALGPAALASGVSNADLFARVFEGTPFEEMFKTLGQRPLSGPR